MTVGTTPFLLLITMAMFAPQYYSPPQQMIPGYVPVYQTPGHGQKRDLSPIIVNAVQQDEKRIRNNSALEGSIVLVSSEIEEEVSLRDIMNHLKKLATKDDLVQVKSTLVAQSAEIQQIKTELNSHQERLKVLEDDAGARAAAEVNRTNRKPDVLNKDRKEYGGAQAASNPNLNRRRNVVIHGIQDLKDDEVISTVLDMCQAVGVILFSSDIVDVTRLGVYEKISVKPPPVRVTFEYNYPRDNLLRRKWKLGDHVRFANMYVNPDEPIGQRRIRGLFRKVAYKARADGKDVVIRSEWIKIGEVTYLATCPRIHDERLVVNEEDLVGLTLNHAQLFLTRFVIKMYHLLPRSLS